MSLEVLITREPADCVELQGLVADCGITVLPYPVFRLEEVEDTDGWRRRLRTSPPPSWLLMASPRAPQRFVRACAQRGAGHLLRLPIAVVGSGTAEAAAEAGLEATVVGPGTGVGLADLLIARWSEPVVAIFACGHERRPELPDALTAAGHTVLPIELYRMRATPPEELPTLSTDVDVVVITSPRAAKLYLAALGGHPLDCSHWALGPTTRDAASAMGIACSIPPEPSIPSLAEELCRI
jgi:uroporphyrinogen-III synthase